MLLYAVVPVDATAPEMHGLAGTRLEIIRGKLAAVIVEEFENLPDFHGRHVVLVIDVNPAA